ncbi:MAG: RidA family protein [Phycisphaeraceae bacterium]|nr:RidA family protein [Phycisphaeraceae bacterium]
MNTTPPASSGSPWTRRRAVQSGAPWEDRVGYARAVRVGPLVFVSGTLAVDAHGAVHGGSDAGAQTAYALDKIERALRALGAAREHVVRTRMFILDQRDADAVGAAHARFFGGVRPCATMVTIAGLAAPGALVEIEVDAVAPTDGDAALPPSAGEHAHA